MHSLQPGGADTRRRVGYASPGYGYVARAVPDHIQVCVWGM